MKVATNEPQPIPTEVSYQVDSLGNFVIEAVEVPDPPKPPMIRSIGNFHKCCYDVAVNCANVLDPVVDLANPINYIKLGIASTQITDVQLWAVKQREEVYNDTRPVDLREHDPLIKDSVYQYRYQVQWKNAGITEYLPPQYFPDVSQERPSLLNRLFYDLREPRYLEFSLSLNILTELYGPKTCAAAEKEDSLIVTKRVFKSNPHNTFLDGRLAGNSVLEDNYLVALRICQNLYQPLTKAPSVK